MSGNRGWVQETLMEVEVRRTHHKEQENALTLKLKWPHQRGKLGQQVNWIALNHTYNVLGFSPLEWVGHVKIRSCRPHPTVWWQHRWLQYAYVKDGFVQSVQNDEKLQWKPPVRYKYRLLPWRCVVWMRKCGGIWGHKPLQDTLCSASG